LLAPPDGTSGAGADAHAVSATGRLFGGRPRLRFWARILPFRNRWPPHTPHGSRRAIAPRRHGSCIGHLAHTALARAMSSICSEKNNAVMLAVPSRQRASAHDAAVVAS